MLTLYGSGPAFGLPDPSPFVMKSDVLLKMSGLQYRFACATRSFLDDDGQHITDSGLIVAHIQRRHGIDLDRSLSADQRARAWAVERLLEDHLYLALIASRWLDDANFEKGPARFFDRVDEKYREETRNLARARVRAELEFQDPGFGCRGGSTSLDAGVRALRSLSAILECKPYLLGNAPSSIDATAFGMLAGVLTPCFDSPLRAAAERHANLVAYNARMTARYYPDFAAAGLAAA